MIAPTTTVLLIDTMGELGYFYGVSDLAFVGGSLANVGGHNLMEAAIAGVPVFMGPHLQNIEDITALFEEKNAMIVVRDAAELAEKLSQYSLDANSREHMKMNADQVLRENQGALQFTINELEELVG